MWCLVYLPVLLEHCLEHSLTLDTRHRKRSDWKSLHAKFANIVGCSGTNRDIYQVCQSVWEWDCMTDLELQRCQVHPTWCSYWRERGPPTFQDGSFLSQLPTRGTTGMFFGNLLNLILLTLPKSLRPPVELSVELWALDHENENIRGWIYDTGICFSGWVLPRSIAEMSECHVSGTQVIQLPQGTQAAVNGMTSLYTH